MKKLHFSTTIGAPKEKVWQTMLDDTSYRDWSGAFGGGSYYRGNWDEGSKILFLGPDPETGGESGMVSRIAENRPYHLISIEHLGLVKDGVEDTTSEAARPWASATERYAFREQDGVTEVQVDLGVPDEYAPMFEEMWPRALSRLKELGER